MSENRTPVIPFYPYPVVRNPNRYQCFDGEKWVYCDKLGNPLKNKGGKHGSV